MGSDTKIEWCDHTFNPWRGCAKVSPGCDHCYAEAWSKRNPAVLGVWGEHGTRVVASEAAWQAPRRWARRWRRALLRRGRVFCASLADWLEDRPELSEPRDRLINLIQDTDDALEWLLLTKRPENLAKLGGGQMAVLKGARARVGVSVESQEHVGRIGELLRWWGGPNFVSAEPLLGPVNLWTVEEMTLRPNADLTVDPPARAYFIKRSHRVDWVIVGGESGPGARPSDVEWIREIVWDCNSARVPCFVKQMGSNPYEEVGPPAAVEMAAKFGVGPVVGRFWDLRDRKGGNPAEWPKDLRVREFP